MTYSVTSRTDEARHKGAQEDETTLADSTNRRQGISFAGQLGHRDQDEMLKDNDTDFPEPDAHAEITGK